MFDCQRVVGIPSCRSLFLRSLCLVSWSLKVQFHHLSFTLSEKCSLIHGEDRIPRSICMHLPCCLQSRHSRLAGPSPYKSCCMGSFVFALHRTTGKWHMVVYWPQNVSLIIQNEQSYLEMVDWYPIVGNNLYPDWWVSLNTIPRGDDRPPMGDSSGAFAWSMGSSKKPQKAEPCGVGVTSLGCIYSLHFAYRFSQTQWWASANKHLQKNRSSRQMQISW